MRDGWEAEAGKWAEFARTPGHDSSHDDINLPALRELLSQPGKRTLDLGCGEGRLSRFLRSLGHRVAGADASPTMDAPFLIEGSYLDAAPADWVAERGGIQLTFYSEHRPIEAYSRALEGAGLLTEAIRETRAPDAVVAGNPGQRRWQRIPLFLHVRAVKPGGARP